MREVWLIRHGESAGNAGAATSAPASIPLTDRGRAQARRVAACVTRRPDLLASSPYLRARLTAAPLRARYPDVPYQEWAVQEFTYLAPARCRDTTFDERKPLVAAYWARGEPHHCDGAGAESFAAFCARVRAAAERLARGDYEFAVLFSHGQFIRALLWLLLSEPGEIGGEAMRAFHAFLQAVPMPNAALLQLRLGPEPGAHYFSGIVKAHLPAELLTG
ncbi:MAG TPA: histidine phosphatase family protein [Pyrinomonadaceae bacterium]